MAKNTRSVRPQRNKIDTGNPRSYSELIKGELAKGELAKSGSDATAPVKATTLESAPVTAKPVVTSGNDNVNWGVEYAQVFSDLRQLTVISVALIILMIVLGFVL